MGDTSIQWTQKTGRALGVFKGAAKRAGVSFEEYVQRADAGEKYCWKCTTWHPRSDFKVDRSRWDGLSPVCRLAASATRKSAYVPSERKRERRFLVPTRDGDKRQARRRINYLVEHGLLPNPNDLPCMDCADMVFTCQYRHEYDHAKGYDGANQLYVEPVCSRCHHSREEARRG